MSEFQREDRYIVIKRSDLKKVPVNYRSHLVEPMVDLLAHLPQRRFAVVESDWPEFEQVWRMIEARVTGAIPEVKRFYSEISGQQCVYASEYDTLAARLKTEALRADAAVGDANEAEAAGKAVTLLLAERTAQRDEGLAREAELKRLLAEAEKPQPLFVATVLKKLRRFEECASDGQGADIGGHWFEILARLGLLNRIQRSPAWWELTDEGEQFLASRRYADGEKVNDVCGHREETP